MDETATVAPITARNAALTVLGFGGYVAFVHLSALIYINSLNKGELAAAWEAYLGGGHALAADAGWVIPLALGTIVTSNVAMFGQTLLKQSLAASSRDTIVLVALGTAGILVAYTITTGAWLISQPAQAARLFLFAGFTAVAVVLAARTGTHFWGNPSAQLSQARQEHIEAKTRLSGMSGRPASSRRVLSAACWVLVPALLLCNAIEADIHLFSGSAPLVAVTLAAGFAFIVLIVVGSLIHALVFLAVVPSLVWRIAAMLSIIVLPIVGLGVPLAALWNVTGVDTHFTTIGIAVLLVTALVLPPSSPFSLRYAAEVFARYGLRRRQRDAARRIRRARSRVVFEAVASSPAT